MLFGCMESCGFIADGGTSVGLSNEVGGHRTQRFSKSFHGVSLAYAVACRAHPEGDADQRHERASAYGCTLGARFAVACFFGRGSSAFVACEPYDAALLALCVSPPIGGGARRPQRDSILSLHAFGHFSAECAWCARYLSAGRAIHRWENVLGLAGLHGRVCGECAGSDDFFSFRRTSSHFG